MTVAETSRSAYETVPRAERQRQVLASLRELGRASDRELAEHLGWPINCVTPRRGELEAAGLVVREAVEKRHGRRVSIWSPAPEQLSLWR